MGRSCRYLWGTHYLPRAVAPYCQGIGCLHRPAFKQGLDDGLHETVAGVAHRTFAVGAEVGQVALPVPDGHGRRGRQVLAAGQVGDGLQAADIGR
ncbi:hypothetical protein D3C72_1818670 [compost metagenome]